MVEKTPDPFSFFVLLRLILLQILLVILLFPCVPRMTIRVFVAAIKGPDIRGTVACRTLLDDATKPLVPTINSR